MTAPGSGHNGENVQNGRELSRNQGKFPLENKVEFRKNRANSLGLALLRKTSVAMHSFVHGTIYTGSELARRVDFHVSSCVSLIKHNSLSCRSIVRRDAGTFVERRDPVRNCRLEPSDACHNFRSPQIDNHLIYFRHFREFFRSILAGLNS